MKAKFYPFIGAVSALVLVLLNLAPGLVLVAEATAYEPSEPSEQVCVTIQRDTFGEVADSFIWSARPETNFNNASLYTGVGSSGEKRSLVHFGLDFLPESTIVQSATFGIWKYSPASEGTVSVYRITESWSEGEPTWNNFASNYDDSIEWGNFVTASGPGLRTADVTGLVSAWVDSTEPNYGLLLRKSVGQVRDTYRSSEFEDVEDRPWLEVCYSTHGDAVSIEVTPAEETVTAGESVTYQATAEDAYGNTWNVTAGTTFSIEAGAGGSWADNVYTSEVAGDWIVTGEYDGLTDTALLHVLPGGAGPATRIEITPAEETVTAGESVTYQATAEDAYGNTWNVTSGTTSSIEAGAGGSWVDNVYTSEAAGDWIVTGEYDGLTDTALLHVPSGGAGTAIRIEITPAEETVTAGESVTYQATAEDIDGNTWDATSDTIFSIEAGAGGSWADNVYTSHTAGDWIVTGEYGDLTDTALLHVLPDSANIIHFEITPAETTVAEGESVTYYATAEDIYGNTWDVTAETIFSIESGASGSWADNVYTSHTNGTWAVTGTYNGLSDTATLHVGPGGAPTVSKIYCPIIVNNHLPDLVVERIIVTSDRVEVVVKNQGTASVRSADAFRVDLYVDPHPAPTTVNQIWDHLSTNGLAWIVTQPALPLAPGGVITLTIGDAYYRPSLSHFPGSLPAGIPVYAQVDSANGDSTYGAVLEVHEFFLPHEANRTYNNISGPVYSALGAVGHSAGEY